MSNCEQFLLQGIDVREMLAGASLMDEANRNTVVTIYYLFSLWNFIEF